MEKWMLPLHDLPTDQRRTKRPPARGLKPAKPLDRRFTTALADPAKVLFLDVETTGLSWFYDDLTIVGWAIDGSYCLHVAGDNPRPLIKALRTAHTLITFNGTLFDLRFLKKTFGEIELPAVHIDLRYLAKRVGLVGGQKAIERELKLPRRVGFEEMDGAEAVLLWHRYLRGDEKALSRLIDYNRHDVLGMCGILDKVMDRLDIHPDLWFQRPKFATKKYTSKARLLRTKGRRNAGRWKVSPSFNGLFQGTPAHEATIVGIDLTGSEARPSGWCLLRGSEADTDMIGSDDEMFARSLASSPALVSIDSPLCLPFGRERVEDDDPGRQQFGIMRQCERELKRRGINVYPCLLPSMQRLTNRGMRLAQRFRSAGIPVIESYPGAAQDIMGIPRKGLGVDFLRQGLADFGVSGSFIDTPATHDELDAITSALVGSFFLSRRYEALRGPSEDALIIPDPKSSGNSKMVIGISGRICAGKTTTARFLEELGFAYTRFSLVIDDEIVARGETPDRAKRQAMGFEINRTKGQRWLCEKAMDRVAANKHIVIDGLRFPEDHTFFFERFGSEFIHLHIQTRDELRAARYREHEQDGVPFEVADAQPVEGKIGELAGLASAVLSNEGSLAEHRANVLNCLKLVSQVQGCECPSQLL
jgi:predicted nuclease with RNAse H fold/dephospho-CoA kinase